MKIPDGKKAAVQLVTQMLHNASLLYVSQYVHNYRITGNFCFVKFSFSQALKAYFRGLIFIVCHEHIIIVAYYLDFRGLIFVLGLRKDKNATKISRYTM